MIEKRILVCVCPEISFHFISTKYLVYLSALEKIQMHNKGFEIGDSRKEGKVPELKWGRNLERNQTRSEGPKQCKEEKRNNQAAATQVQNTGVSRWGILYEIILNQINKALKAAAVFHIPFWCDGETPGVKGEFGTERSLLRQIIWYVSGILTTPTMPSMLMGGALCGQEKSNLCRRDVKKMKSSVLARVSPRHTLGPRAHTHRHILLYYFDILVYIAILNSSMQNSNLQQQSCLTQRKSQEVLVLAELSITIQEVFRVKRIWVFPVLLIHHNCH